MTQNIVRRLEHAAWLLKADKAHDIDPEVFDDATFEIEALRGAVQSTMRSNVALLQELRSIRDGGES